MKDIFICHSSLDRETVDKACKWIEEKGFSCWVSYRTEDLQPGIIYTEKIVEMIDSCKLFIVFVSNNSVNSEQVRQEVCIANERQRYGLRIFPVIIGDPLNMDAFHRYMGYVLAGKEMIHWEDSDARNELIKLFTLHLGSKGTGERAGISSVIPAKQPFIGREKELEYIYASLMKNRRLCVSGLGGIGKTALLQAFCHSEKSKVFSKIIYLHIENCLLRTLGNDNKLVIQSDLLQEKRKTLSDYEYALYKLSLLENNVSPSSLVILDNLEMDTDPLFDRICNLNCNIIISTRNPNLKISGFDRLTITELQSPELACKLFGLHYHDPLTREELSTLNSLLKQIKYHTLTVVLLAKQMRYFNKKPSDYNDISQLRVERTQIFSENGFDEGNGSDITSLYTQLFNLFDSSTLSAEEKHIMKVLCMLPAEGFQKPLFIKLLGNNYGQVISKLEETGWIQNTCEKTIVALHPLVKDVVIHELGIHIDDPDISKFFSSFIQTISDNWNSTYDDNIIYKELALSIYYLFPLPQVARFKDYIVLSQYLWVLNCIDISLEIQNKVKLLFIDSNGNHQNSPEEAEALLQIGFTYQGKGDYVRSAQELENAAKIYGNKYASALSHLAQAQMSIREKPIEEIEPLLRESLAIRSKYWPGTVSEGASCHLYAKTLSSYGVKLDYAIQLEKRAYRIFAKLQPGGVNVSSASYILGWLYIQTASDEDDISFGIERLEEAKQIRIKHRGDPLHPWMEDIYLKLGLAYDKKGNAEKAKEYFELLLDVRNSKYSNDPSQEPIAEVYELLLSVYSKLNDTEKVKRIKKYLKYHV